MPGPRNEFEEHLVELADGDPGFLADASARLGYELEEPSPPTGCPRCGRTVEEDEQDRMVESAAAEDVLICHDCEIAEERIQLRGGTPQPRESWPVDLEWELA